MEPVNKENPFQNKGFYTTQKENNQLPMLNYQCLGWKLS
jgi:hypothetical protein